jgi:hypothetical protein
MALAAWSGESGLYLTHATEHFGFHAHPTHKTKALNYALGVNIRTYGVDRKEPNCSKPEGLIIEKYAEFIASVAPAFNQVDEPLYMVVADLNAAYQDSGNFTWVDGRKIPVSEENDTNELSEKVSGYFDKFGRNDVVGRMDATLKMGRVDFMNGNSVECAGVARVSSLLPGNPFRDVKLIRDYYQSIELGKLPFHIPVGIDLPTAMEYLVKHNLTGGMRPSQMVLFPRQFVDHMARNRNAVRKDAERLVEQGRLRESTI